MLWWKFAKFIMSFLKGQVIFPSNFGSIFSAIKNNSSILFLVQTLFALVKSSLLKCKFLRFSSAPVKICQIPPVNFELTSQFFLTFQIILHCIFVSFFILSFRLMHFPLWIKGSHQSPNLYSLSDVLWWKFVKFLMSFLKAQVSFRSNVVSIFSAQTLHTLFKRSPLKCKFLRFLSDQDKICQIPVNFELTHQFLFEFCIILHCHDAKLPCKF